MPQILDAETLAKRAKELRALAERAESLARRQREIEKEQAELSRLLGAMEELPPVAPTVAAAQVAPSGDGTELLPPPLSGKTQIQGMQCLIRAWGPLTYKQLFEGLQHCDRPPKRPADVSALLSRHKDKFRPVADGRWSVIESA